MKVLCKLLIRELLPFHKLAGMEKKNFYGYVYSLRYDVFSLGMSQICNITFKIIQDQDRVVCLKQRLNTRHIMQIIRRMHNALLSHPIFEKNYISDLGSHF